jgi:transcriptional regulator with XRE-family HTH domain
MTPLLSRTARTILGWTQTELGKYSGTSLNIVRYYESARRVSPSDGVDNIRRSLTGAGINFIEERGMYVAVRMKGLSWPARCRGARALLDWTQLRVAEASEVSEMTVMRLELERFPPTRATLAVVRAALEDAGVIFLEDDGRLGPGVRLR